MLEQWLSVEAFGFTLVVSRIMAMLMVVPALGEASIPTRVRMSFAFLLALVLYPLLRSSLPDLPSTPFQLFPIVALEVMIGIIFGLLARMVMAALHIAATVSAFQVGLAAAQQFDPGQQSQGALMAAFFSVLAVTLIFMTDMHHLIIAGIYGSYEVFPVGEMINVEDMAALAVETVVRTFHIGIQLASPFIIYGLVFYLGLGLIGRLMPQLPVFFVAMPINIYMGFAILLITLSSIMAWFLGYFEGHMSQFVR